MKLAIGGCALLLAVWGLGTLLGSLVLGFFWNLVVPSAFGGPALDGVQAFALTVLIGILFSRPHVSYRRD